MRDWSKSKYGGRAGGILLSLCMMVTLAGCAAPGREDPAGQGIEAPGASLREENGSPEVPEEGNQGTEFREEGTAQAQDGEERQAPAEDPVPLPSDYVTEEMYERAVAFLQGDLTRLAAVMRRARAGEDITVGVIGGSITEGYSASNRARTSYACNMRNWWQERFPDITVEYVNAGIGGTSSYLGVHRVQEDLLEQEPDFVIVEFSVNDGNNQFFKISYDNLLRRILLDENDPALLLLFTTQENGTSAQTNDALLGFGYGLPMISYGNAVLPSIEAGEFAWKDISPDNIHPNDRGHAIIGELLYRYLNDVYARLDEISEEVTPFTAKAQTKERYLKGRVLDGADLSPVEAGSFTEQVENGYFPYEYYWHTKGGGEAIVFEIEAANIGMLYQRDVDPAFGQYDVYIDGIPMRTLDGYFEGGWGNSMEAVELYVSDEAALHRVEVRKNPDSTGDLFTILCWLVS